MGLGSPETSGKYDEGVKKKKIVWDLGGAVPA
jgi:hypothetical protein